jgi:hypothetical protein
VCDGICFRNIEGAQDKANLSLVFIPSLFWRKIQDACEAEKDFAQRAFDLAQAVTNQVRRCLKGRIDLHDPAGVLIKGGWSRSNTGQPRVHTNLLFSLQRRGSISNDQRLFFSLSTSHSRSFALERELSERDQHQRRQGMQERSGLAQVFGGRIKNIFH